MAALVENPDALPNAVLARATPDAQVLAHAIDARESVYRVVFVNNLGGGMLELYPGTGFAIRTEGNKSLILTCAHVLTSKDGSFINQKKSNRNELVVRKMGHTEDERVQDFYARVVYANQLADLAVIEATGIPDVQPLTLDESDIVLHTTAVAVGYCDVEDYQWTRMPTVSTGVTTSQPYRVREGGFRDRVLVDLSCVASPGMSGCPVVSVGGRVIGVVAGGTVDTVTKRLRETYAIYASKVLEVMKQWVGLPDSEVITIDEVIGLL